MPVLIKLVFYKEDFDSTMDAKDLPVKDKTKMNDMFLLSNI